MTKRKPVFQFLLLSAIVLSGIQVGAMEPVLSDDIVSAHAVLIRNTGDQKIVFWLENGDGAWAQFTLAPRDHDTYNYATEIWLPTEDTHVEYRLEFKHRYLIIWDEENGYWDVKEQILAR